MQADNLVVYLTKHSTHFPRAYQRWLQYHIVLNASFLGTPLPKQGAPVLKPLLPQKGSWMLLWVDKGQVLVFHRAEQPWQNRSFPSSFSSRFPYPFVILFVWSHLGWSTFWPFLENVLALPPPLLSYPVFDFIFPTMAGLPQTWGASPLSPQHLAWLCGRQCCIFLILP